MKRYKNIKILRNPEGIRYYGTTKYPDIPLSQDDIYVYTTEGDRFDTLANEYYGDSTLWWVISAANPTLPQNSYTPPAGIQLRIPTNTSSVISSLNTLNG